MNERASWTTFVFRSWNEIAVRSSRPGVDPLHRPAGSLVEVVEVIAAAQRLGKLVDDVAAGRRRAPREILAPADQDIKGDAWERGAARVDAAAVQVLLEQELRERVTDLRPGDEEGI